MLSKEDEAFIVYWEKNRLARKKTLRQFLLGVPLGLLITVPTVISLSSGWYRRAYAEANSADFDPRVLFVALLLIVAFSAIFWQRHRWDQHEQHYRELLARRDRDRARASSVDGPPLPAPPQSVPPQVPPQSVPPQVPPQSVPSRVPPQSVPSQSVPSQSVPSQSVPPATETRES